MNCELCPHRCGVDRRLSRGACGAPDALRVSRVSRHTYEEPCISGTRGSGTVFFSGCVLSCVFCQNKPISRDLIGEDISVRRLSELFLELQAAGVHNVNLVTPTQYTDKICEALAAVKGELHVPVVWNSGGYERPETLERVRGLVDIYMPDFKYISSELSLRYSGVGDYAERTAEAIAFMYKMLGRAEFDEGGLMRRGVLVRHLVLPACRRDSEAVLRRLAEIVPPADVVLGLMSQYTPSFYSGEEKNLRRRVTTFEYESVRKLALELGFEGYMQSPMSATAEFTPKFTNALTIEL
jgi:putative pyruvate formate lyase activating enzyme